MKRTKITDVPSYYRAEAEVSAQVIKDQGITKETGASIVSALHELDRLAEESRRRKGLVTVDAQEIDDMTPKYKDLLESRLSPNERRLLVAIIRIVRDTHPFTLHYVRGEGQDLPA
jgi:hypothetical protein